MNELLQKHGCSAVFSAPEGLKELMSDITREVLREQPDKIFDFIANYLSVLILTREHGLLAVKLLDDLCDCRPTVSEHLLQLGLDQEIAGILSEVIKEEIEEFEPVKGKETVKEMQIVKRILGRVALDEDTAERVCQISRNAYRDYWYRKKLLEKALKTSPEEPWQIAADRTLEIYKKTKPSFTELNRATQQIQAAYRGYYVRKNLLRHLKVKPKKTGPKVDLFGAPVDVAHSRTIDLGPIITLNVREDDVSAFYEKHTSKKLGLQYDPMKTITHVDDDLVEIKKISAMRPSEATRRVSIQVRKEKSDKDIQEISNTKRSMPSVASLRSVQSSQTPGTTSASSGHGISFAGLPVKFEPEITYQDDDLPEIPEEIIAPLVEIAPEIPDDIEDTRSEGDGRSTASSMAITPREMDCPTTTISDEEVAAPASEYVEADDD